MNQPLKINLTNELLELENLEVLFSRVNILLTS